MNRILSRLGLRPDPDFACKQAVEDVVAQARLDYLKWSLGGEIVTEQKGTIDG